MTPDTTHHPKISLGSLFKVLADPHRRYTMYHLATMDGETVEFPHLVEALSEHVDTPPERLKIDLRYAQLLKLADYKLIEYDERSETIRYRGGERVETVLEFAQSEEERE
jgi:hypothetical protein